jgi:hypothetical protein
MQRQMNWYEFCEYLKDNKVKPKIVKNPHGGWHCFGEGYGAWGVSPKSAWHHWRDTLYGNYLWDKIS